VLPGADPVEPARAGDDRVRIAFIDREERGALRLFLRALRRLDLALPWEVTVVSDRGPSSSTPLRPELRERVTYVEGGDAEVLARSDVLVAASDGAAPAPGLLLQAIAAGVVPVASSLAVYEELLYEGERGVMFAANEPNTLAAQLTRLVADTDRRETLAGAGAPLRAQLEWSRLADE
jgi:glycosyltransferase involved in cell wall biosynthesis